MKSGYAFCYNNNWFSRTDGVQIHLCSDSEAEAFMNPYYASLLREVITLFGSHQYEQASVLIKKELAMPYVPLEVQDILENYLDECRPYLRKSSSFPSVPIEDLIDGTLRQKEMAASMMMRMNLRQIPDLLAKLLLDHDLSDEIKGELIEAMMEQKMEGRFGVYRNGKTVHFEADRILKKTDDPVYLRTLEYFDDWMTADNPGMAEFCRQLLDQEALVRRPYDFSTLEAKRLACSIAALVYEALQDPEGYEDFAYEHCLQKVEKYPLFIERRGE